LEAAFFDLDKTVIATSSVMALGGRFYREGLISKRTIVRGIYAQVVYLLLGADDEKMERMREAMLGLTKGWDQQRVSDIVRETLDEVLTPIIYAEALELIEEHKKAGRKTVIVSSSPIETVAPLASFRRAIARRGIHAHEPSRAVADQIVLLMLRHIVVGHTGEIVVRLVVVAHMLEAETVILAFVATTLGRGVESGLSAALPLTSGAGVAHESARVGLDAEAVEEFRVELHSLIMGSEHVEGKRPIACVSNRGAEPVTPDRQRPRGWDGNC